MLEFLKLHNVGPAPEIELELAPRLNLITGDNGAGKSFLLDVAWWALTRRWPHDLNPDLASGYPARPSDPKAPASIAFRIRAKTTSVEYESKYSPRDQAFIGKAGRPANPGLIIYAHADGGFSVWDPARNHWRKKGNTDVPGGLPAYVFSARQIWDGLEVDVDGKPTIVCNGLIADWASWVREAGPSANRMDVALHDLSPEGEGISTGPLVRLSVTDARDIPSIRTPYHPAVPILHASSGIRRIVGLAYILLWSWREHVLASKSLGEERTNRVVLLFDEIESHLHPRWQRSILKSVLGIAKLMHDEAAIQVLAATHSPLILASAEPTFDHRMDAWFDLDIDPQGAKVVVEKRRFERRGTAGRWLTSPAFDLPSEGRSLEADHAIAAAEALLQRKRDGHSITSEELEGIDEGLRRVLPDIDRFWVRWSAEIERWRVPGGSMSGAGSASGSLSGSGSVGESGSGSDGSSGKE
jgi:hypothetical protein